MPIIDSSVFVKYLSKEEGWKEAETHLLRPSTVPLALKEIANALRTKTLNGEISPDDAKQMIKKLASVVRFVNQDDLIIDSYQIAVDHRITVYDALFIAAALNSKEELITCDNEQAKVGRSLNLRVRTVS
jgi:predicted nucleic acid-binding protein